MRLGGTALSMRRPVRKRNNAEAWLAGATQLRLLTNAIILVEVGPTRIIADSSRERKEVKAGFACYVADLSLWKPFVASRGDG